ncbi:MAG: hypothetical protein RL367_544, partial [Pseudomonadota bacterium]
LFVPRLAVSAQWVASTLMVLTFYALGILGLARPDSLLAPPAQLFENLLEPATRREKYARSALADDDVARIAAKLESAMERDQPFLDPSLTLPRLAALVGASVNDVSQAINAAFSLNYYEFINRYRIQAASARLADSGDQATILDICLDAGFNSKSVFNAAFKREVGQTPSAFRAQDRTGV